MDKEKFTRNIAYVGAVALALAIQKFLLIPILTKNLGVDYYGVWANVINTVMLLVAVGSVGMGPTIVRFMSAETDKQKISRDFFLIFGLVFFSTLILSIACYLSSNIIALFILKNLKYSIFIKIACALIIIETWNAIILTLFKALKLFKTYAFVYITYAVVELSLFWYLLSAKCGLMEIILASIFIKILLLFVGLIITKFQVGWHLPDAKRLRFYLTYGLPLTLIPFYNWIIRVSDQYIIGFFYSVKEIGVYSLHYSLAFLLFNLTAIIMFVLSPTITKFWEENKIKEVREFIKYSYKYIMLLLIPSIIGYFFLYDGIIRNVSTRAFMTTRFLILILATSTIFASIYALLQSVLLLLKKTKIINKITLGAALLNLVLNYILVPKIGMIGAALSTLLTFVLLTLLSLAYTPRKYKFDFMFPTVLKSLIAAVVMGIALLPFNNINIFALLGQVAFGAVVYFISLYVLKAISVEEIKFFMRFYKK